MSGGSVIGGTVIGGTVIGGVVTAGSGDRRRRDRRRGDRRRRDARACEIDGTAKDGTVNDGTVMAGTRDSGARDSGQGRSLARRPAGGDGRCGHGRHRHRGGVVVAGATDAPVDGRRRGGDRGASATVTFGPSRRADPAGRRPQVRPDRAGWPVAGPLRPGPAPGRRHRPAGPICSAEPAAPRRGSGPGTPPSPRAW